MERQCKDCTKMKAPDEYERTASGGYRGACRDCRRGQALARFHERETKAAAEWSDFADDVIRERYPMGGSVACKPFLPERTIAAINKRASRLGVGAYGDDAPYLPWPLPQQDSAPMHLLFQRTRVPVFGSALVASV